MASLPPPFSADIPQYADKIEERFVPWVEDGGGVASPVFSLRSGSRKRRVLSSSELSGGGGGVDFVTAHSEAQVISSNSEMGNVIGSSRKRKEKTAGPAKIRRRKSSPKLTLGRGPNS